MLLPETDLTAANYVAERLRLHTELSEMAEGVRNITISLGITNWSEQSNYSVEEALTIADKALYVAKKQGRNRVITAPEDDETAI